MSTAPRSKSSSKNSGTKSAAKKATTKKATEEKAATEKAIASKDDDAKASSKKTPQSATKPAVKKARRPKTEVDPEVLEFIEAIDQFKQDHGRPFPSWSEVLWVVHSLGYTKG